MEGAHGKHKEHEGPCSAGNSLQMSGSDVRRCSPGTAVWNGKLRPDMRCRRVKCRGPLLCFRRLGPVFPREEGGEEFVS